MIPLVDTKIKCVIRFTTTKNFNAVKNVLNKIELKIDTALQNEFSADITNLVITHKKEVTDMGNNEFEIYPKTMVSGDFNGTREEFDARIDGLLDAFKTEFGNEISAFGGTISLNGFHLHRLSGSVDEN